MRVAILTDETGWHTRQLQAALRARGALGRCVDLADCHIDTRAAWHGLVIPGFGRELPDAALVRGIAGGSFEQVTKRLGVLHALRAMDVPVYNEARAIERSVDKSMTSLLLHAAGIATPPAWATESVAEARRIVMREVAAGHALVAKPLFGSQGKGLQRIDDVGALPAFDDAYGGLAYLQRFVPQRASPGHDFRVLVVGGRALTAMRRVSEDWIHNVARGADARTRLRGRRPDAARRGRLHRARGQRGRGLARAAARERLQHRPGDRRRPDRPQAGALGRRGAARMSADRAPGRSRAGPLPSADRPTDSSAEES